MDFDLKEKVVLITGGASGIGLSCVKALLRNEVQAVAIADVNSTNGGQVVSDLMKEFEKDRVIFVKIDVTKTGHLEAAFKITLDFWKTIDIVINNATIMNDNQWEYEISLNCNAVVQGTLLGLHYMGKDKGGKGGVIVNMSSIHALQPFPALPVYAGTKNFVIGFSRSFADSYHYNRTGVKILTMCPGVTDTNLITCLGRRPLKLSPDIGQKLTEEIQTTNIQSVDKVAEAMITLIKKRNNDSVCIVEGNKPMYEILIPHRSTFRKLYRH